MATWYTATEMDTWHSDAFDFTWADNDKKVTLTLKNGYQWPPGQTYQIAGSHYIKDKNGLGAYTNDVFRIEPNEFTPFVPRSQTVAFSVAADTQAPPIACPVYTGTAAAGNYTVTITSNEATTTKTWKEWGGTRPASAYSGNSVK